MVGDELFRLKSIPSERKCFQEIHKLLEHRRIQVISKDFQKKN